MFNLIIAVSSIALIAGISGASVYYGGNVLSGSSAKAQAVTLVNQGQQLGAAQQMHMALNNGVVQGDMAPLVTAGFLKAAPEAPSRVVHEGSSWSFATTEQTFYARLTLASDVYQNVCEKIVDAGGEIFLDMAAFEASNARFGCHSGEIPEFLFKISGSATMSVEEGLEAVEGAFTLAMATTAFQEVQALLLLNQNYNETKFEDQNNYNYEFYYTNEFLFQSGLLWASMATVSITNYSDSLTYMSQACSYFEQVARAGGYEDVFSNPTFPPTIFDPALNGHSGWYYFRQWEDGSGYDSVECSTFDWDPKTVRFNIQSGEYE